MSTAKPSFICIIKAGSTVGDIASMQGDFEDWIRDGLLPGLSEAEGRPSIQVIDVHNGDTPGALPDIAGCAGVVISGSHAMVADAEPWMVELGTVPVSIKADVSDDPLWQEMPGLP